MDGAPDDAHLRLVFADWLEEHDDPRAEGYRTVVSLKLRVDDFVPSCNSTRRHVWCWWTSIYAHRPRLYNVPVDWFALLTGYDAKSSEGKQFRNYFTPSAAHDALARAFVALPADRRADLLAGR